MGLPGLLALVQWGLNSLCFGYHAWLLRHGDHGHS